MTGRTSTLWDYPSTTSNWDFAYTMSNNRVAGSGYDNDGRQIMDPHDGNQIDFQYDAAGRMEKTWRSYDNAYETMMYHDGNGVEAKRRQRTWDTQTNNWGAWESVYFITSTVLGRTITETTKAPETTQTGKKKYTYIIAGGTAIARQELSATNVESVGWQLTDAAGLSSRGFDNAERDGLGNNVGMLSNFNSSRDENAMTAGQSLTFNDMGMGDCSGNGIFGPCSLRETAFFAQNPRLPFEAGAHLQGGRDNPYLLNLISRQDYGFAGGPDPLLMTSDERFYGLSFLMDYWRRLHLVFGAESNDDASAPGETVGNCGVNPVTGRPRIVGVASGIEGEIRPGIDGGGFFDSRRPNNRSGRHLAVDLSFGSNSVLGTILNSGAQYGKDQYFHRGSIVAFGTGSVIDVGYQSGALGNYVVIDHNLGGLTSTYAHLALSSPLKVGDEVAMGNYIGIGGQTGNAQGQGLLGNRWGATPAEAHLHFILKRNGTPIDPISFLNNPCPAWLTPNSKRRR